MKIKKSSLFRGTALVLAVILCAVSVSAPVFAVTSQSIAVPLFQHPSKGSFWNDVAGAGGASVPFLVANPSNGPGSTADAAYTDKINAAATAGIRSLGYVQTNDQSRSFKDLYDTVDAWYRLYPKTQGIYVDLLKQRSTADVCYTAALYTRIKNTHPNDLVVLNFSGNVSPTYEPYGDIFVNAETDYESYRDNWKPQYKGFEDSRTYQNRFWHRVHGVKAEDFSAAFSTTRENNAGWVYLTDRSQASPYSATPGFWQNEANEVRALPPSAIPNRGMTTLPRGCISLGFSSDNTVDSTEAKQTKTTSLFAVNNTDTTYDSPPATKLEIVTLPTGSGLAAISGEGWTCDATTKGCSFSGSLPAKGTTPAITTVVTAGCDFKGGDVKARLTNYAGNRWDVKVPVQVPFGCEASTAAGKVNTDATGQITRFTTQGAETTPEIKLPGVTAQKNQAKEAPKEAKGSSLGKTLIVILIVLVVIGLGTWYVLWLRHHDRYKVESGPGPL